MKRLYGALLLSCALVLAVPMQGFAREDGAKSEPKSFLTIEESINSDFILPPPPAFDSIEFLADKAAYDKYTPLVGSARWKQAAIDADLSPENTGKPFSEAFGVDISKENTPVIYDILTKLRTDAGGYSTKAAKEKYMRMRPFVFFNSPSCQPEEEEHLRKNGSYPSGHTAIGWSTALVLAEIRPERANEILKRGYEFGQSRVICRAHWQSDVNQGRVVGSAQVARLHSNPEFLAEMQKAKEEIKEVLAKGK